MIAKITLLAALLAVTMAAPGGIIAPAAVTYNAAPLLGAPALAYAAHAPIATYAAGPIIAPAPITYTSGVKVAHVYSPVEQHGYKIAY